MPRMEDRRRQFDERSPLYAERCLDQSSLKDDNRSRMQETSRFGGPYERREFTQRFPYRGRETSPSFNNHHSGNFSSEKPFMSMRGGFEGDTYQGMRGGRGGYGDQVHYGSSRGGRSGFNDGATRGSMRGGRGGPMRPFDQMDGNRSSRMDHLSRHSQEEKDLTQPSTQHQAFQQPRDDSHTFGMTRGTGFPMRGRGGSYLSEGPASTFHSSRVPIASPTRAFGAEIG